MDSYWIGGGFVAIVVVVLPLLTRILRGLKRRETLRRMGLPAHGPLTIRQIEALRVFEDTAMKFKKSFPHISEAQRRAMTNDVLREKGVLPRARPRSSS